MAYVGLPFPGTGCPVPDVVYDYLLWNNLCAGHSFCTCLSHGNVSVHGSSFRKNELNKIPRATSLWYLHTILRIISKGVPDWAIDSPCGVWDRGWTTCFLCDGPILSLIFQLSVGVIVWYGGEGFFYWFVAFVHVLHITPVCLLLFGAYEFTLKYFLY